MIISTEVARLEDKLNYFKLWVYTDETVHDIKSGYIPYAIPNGVKFSGIGYPSLMAAIKDLKLNYQIERMAYLKNIDGQIVARFIDKRWYVLPNLLKKEIDESNY